MLYLNKLCVIMAKFRVRFNQMSQSNKQISHNSDIQEKKKRKSSKNKLGIKEGTSKVSRGILSKIKTSEEATRGLEAASFRCSEVIVLIKRLKSNTFARRENASDRALVALIRFFLGLS